MNYNPTEFREMKFNVMSVQVGRDITNVEEFKDLKNIFIGILHKLPKGISANKIIRFIVLCYDKKSPLVKKELVDIIERKKQAMNLAGYKPNKSGMFTEQVMEIIAGQNKIVNHLILRWLKMQDSLDFMTMCFMIESHSQILESLNNKEDDKEDALSLSDKKIKVMNKLAEVRKSIDDLAEGLFQKDINLQNFVGSFDVEEKHTYKVTPEQWAS